MSNFTFLAVGHDMFPDHTYLLDGVRLPSVTEIIDYAFDTYAGVPKDLLERAKLFGNAIHKTIELYIRDDLDYINLDPVLLACLESFRAWEADYPEIACELETAAIETPMYHPKLKYAGTADICGETFIIDLKSRPVNLLTDPIQLSAYNAFDGKARDRYVLELRQDKTYVFTQVDKTIAARKRSWERFRYLYDFYKMGKEIERWKTQ